MTPLSAIRSAAGRKGGKRKSKAKTKAARKNAKLGGRPRTVNEQWFASHGTDL